MSHWATGLCRYPFKVEKRVQFSYGMEYNCNNIMLSLFLVCFAWYFLGACIIFFFKGYTCMNHKYKITIGDLLVFSILGPFLIVGIVVTFCERSTRIQKLMGNLEEKVGKILKIKI